MNLGTGGARMEIVLRGGNKGFGPLKRQSAMCADPTLKDSLGRLVFAVGGLLLELTTF